MQVEGRRGPCWSKENVANDRSIDKCEDRFNFALLLATLHHTTTVIIIE